MTILALDPATAFGWALWHGAGIHAAGTWDLSTRPDESTGMKLVRMRAKLREVHLAYPPAVVVFERPNHTPGRPQATISHAKFVGVIEAYCIDNGLEYRGYSPDEIKKHALAGRKKGEPRDKAAMVAAAKKRWPDFDGDDNEADARWLASLAATELTTPPVRAA